MSDSEDPAISESGDADLFGDEDDNLDQVSDHPRDEALSDRDLESNQGEEDRYDGYDDESAPPHIKSKIIATVNMFRHRTPKSKDGSLQSIRVPDFIKISPEEYVADTYKPSTFDVENSKIQNPKPVVRWRKNAKSGKIESNANIYRWSDGSVTLQIGDQYFEMQTKMLATPTGKPYQKMQDAHYYAAAAHLSSNSMLVVGHITEQYTVRPNTELQDEALLRLTQRLAQESRSANSSDGPMIVIAREDPELQKKQAELAEKERLRAQRRRETVAARLDGSSRYNRGALSIGDLEGGRRAPGAGRKRGAPALRQKRRRPEYDSDDDLPQGAHRQEEYDMEDDFIAPSDEEISEGGDDDDEEELLDDDDEEEAPRSKRQKTAEQEDDDADAEADLDDDVMPTASAEQSSRHRRRNVIEDDDEE